MRLDKFLKVSRLIKRRTVANQACDNGRIMLNDKIAKASSKVAVGDIVTMTLGAKETKIRVLDIKEHTLKENAAYLYEIIEE